MLHAQTSTAGTERDCFILYNRSEAGSQYMSHTQTSKHCRTACTERECFIVYSRSEEGSQYMSHAQTSKHCRTTRNLQFRWHALYGL